MGGQSRGFSAVVQPGASGAGPDEQLGGQLIQPYPKKSAFSYLKWWMFLSRQSAMNLLSVLALEWGPWVSEEAPCSRSAWKPSCSHWQGLSIHKASAENGTWLQGSSLLIPNCVTLVLQLKLLFTWKNNVIHFFFFSVIFYTSFNAV